MSRWTVPPFGLGQEARQSKRIFQLPITGFHNNISEQFAVFDLFVNLMIMYLLNVLDLVEVSVMLLMFLFFSSNNFYDIGGKLSEMCSNLHAGLIPMSLSSFFLRKKDFLLTKLISYLMYLSHWKSLQYSLFHIIFCFYWELDIF